MPFLIDTHCHIDFDAFNTDRDEILQRALGKGVQHIICPATHRQGWGNLSAICRKGSFLIPTYGLHPMFLHRHQASDLKDLRCWIDTEQPHAIGECGLDFYDKTLDRSKQEFFFEGHIELAREFKRPLIIHARKSVERVTSLLHHHTELKGVFHSYSGSWEQAQILIKRGFSFGFGGPITWEGSHKLHRLIRKIPLQYILLETDAPDQPDNTHRGSRNEPSYLPIIAEAVARLKGITTAEVARVTTANARRLFNLP